MKRRTHTHSMLLLALVITLVFSSVIFTPIKASAKVTYQDSNTKSERYFKDVKKKSAYRSEIEWLAERQAYQGIAKRGGKLKPNTIITRRQVGTILDNLYGDRIDIVISKPNNKATQKFVTNLLTKVSGQLGYRITWSGGAPKAKVSRAKFSHYLYQMIKSCKTGKLDPKLMSVK